MIDMFGMSVVVVVVVMAAGGVAICSQHSEHFPIFSVEHQLTSVHQLFERWQLVVRGMAKQEGEGEVKWGSQHPNKMLRSFKLMLQWQKPNDFICKKKKNLHYIY